MLCRLHMPWPRSSRRSSPGTTTTRERTPRGGHARTAAPYVEDGGVYSVKTAGFSDVQELRQVDTHRGTILSVRFSPDGTHFIVGGKHGTVERWEVKGGNPEKLVQCEGEADAIAVSKDGRWIVVAGTEGRKIMVWDAVMRQKVSETREVREREITALDVSHDGSKFASGAQDGTVVIWCLETGLPLAAPFTLERTVLSVRFSPTGEYLAGTGWSYSIRVWDLSGNNGHYTPYSVANPALSLAWSNDGRRLFAGCHRGSILAFDLSGSVSDEFKQPGRSHIDSVSTLWLSNNGKFIVSTSSSENSIKLWDAQSRVEIRSLQHTCEILHTATTPDDSLLVVGTKEGKVFIWDLRELIPVANFYRSLTARLTAPCRSGLGPTLTEISNTAYLSWRKSLVAEEILSNEIRCGLSHYALANRALVRARLRRWDAALDDAEASLNVVHSFTSFFAMGIAQFGLGRRNDAIESFDQAVRNSSHEEQSFVQLCRAIAFFDSGLRDDDTFNIKALGHSASIRHPCGFVKAKMRGILASEAMDRQEYAEAADLFVQARNLCPPGQCSELEAVSFLTGWDFDGLRLMIYRRLCEAYYAAVQIHQGLDIMRELERVFRNEIELSRELNGWLVGFKSRCISILESQGDEAKGNGDYDGAIAQYSAAFDINPTSTVAATLLVKRSGARMSLHLWDEALMDADLAIKLDPSSHQGYEQRHAALHELGRYEEAISAMTKLISILDHSSDPNIRHLRRKYVSPADTKKAILRSFSRSVDHFPFRLIDTSSGRLCDAEKRKEIFMEDPTFQKLVSSMAAEPQRDSIDTVTREYSQYVMLSHRWEGKELELTDISDKSIYDLDDSPSATKLKRFCTLVRDAKFRWAWSDTCCIDKEKDVEFEKSINSMFQWYRRSAATIVYLTGVLPRMLRGALKDSIWMTRGWTLQELLAPRVLRFYYQDWTPYLNDLSPNHKESDAIMQELHDATNVTAYDLRAFHPGPENARIKLRLASTRETTVLVDMAYGLFGIFGITLPVIHGESPQTALGRLFQAIMTRSGDAACLAWIGQSSEFNSAFPDHIQVYQRTPSTVSHVGEDMERQVAQLQRTWAREEKTHIIAFYQGLCKLPPARCTDHRISLPCIVFPLTDFKKVRIDTTHAYRATTNALQDTDIQTKEKIQAQAPEDLLLVCPWIYELLDSTPPSGGYSHPLDFPGGDAESSHGNSELAGSDSEGDKGLTDLQGTSTRSPSSSEPLLFDSPTSSEPTQNAELKAAKLAIRFRQPLGALLLLAKGSSQYKRVATDCDIIIRVREEFSFDHMDLRTLEVL